MKTSDPVNPQHYRNSQGVQLIEVIRWLPFSLGNAIKYTYRSAQKENLKQDLEKALWYLSDYLKNPTTVACAAEKITADLISNVFSGVDTFEETSSLLLLSLHEKKLKNEDITALGQAAQELLSIRIEELSSL